MPAIEEDYRVKNAREGKAVYVSGKTGEVNRQNNACCLCSSQ